MNDQNLTLSVLFFVSRLLLFLSLPLAGIKSYGDFWNFFQIAEIGTPYIKLWVEFPPVFPFISRFGYLLSSGREHTYILLMAIIFSFFQAGTVYLVGCVLEKISQESIQERLIVYFAITIGVFYGWAYFDSINVFFLVLGVYFFVTEKDSLSAAAIAFGALTKWIPLILIPVIWKRRSWKKAVRYTVISLAIITMVWAGLFLIAPENVKASLYSQNVKGSWESIWALLDGNLKTGNFGPEVDRTDPGTIIGVVKPDEFIPSWLSLLLIGGFGFWIYLKSNIENNHQAVALLGFTLTLFLLWTPGYSPQWVLLLIPLVIISSQNSQYALLAVLILLVNLLEWPVLLSRGYFERLWLVILMRTIIYGLTAYTFYMDMAGLAPVKLENQNEK
jgi:hypothetical protein